MFVQLSVDRSLPIPFVLSLQHLLWSLRMDGSLRRASPDASRGMFEKGSLRSGQPPHLERRYSRQMFLANSWHDALFARQETRLAARVFWFRVRFAPRVRCAARKLETTRIDRCLARAPLRTATTPCTAAFDVIDVPSCHRENLSGKG